MAEQPKHPALDDTIVILEQLVGFDTTSHLSNLDLITYVESIFADYPIASHRVENDDKTKSSILATLGELNDGGIVLSGHTDVVPVEGQDWKTDPFTVVKQDDLLYGRGTSDMKGFIACSLAMLPTFKTRAKSPIHFAFSYDEEVGCLSAPDLARFMAKQPFKPALIVVGEPTEMEVVDAHKSILSHITYVGGLEGHSSSPDKGVNAVNVGAELVCFLMQLAEKMKDPAKLNVRFDPPHSTVHVGKFQGGTARNIIPNHAEIAWEVRGLPEADMDEIFAEFEAFCAEKQSVMQKIHPQAAISHEQQSCVPGLAADSANPELPHLLHACGHNHTHAVPFGTEAGIFQQHGFNAVVIGPGSIDQAHKANEFVAISQLNACLWFLETLCCEQAVM